MKCAQCRKGIPKNAERKAKIVFADGRLKAAYHANCWASKQRIEMLKATNRMPPSAYELKSHNRDDIEIAERLAVRQAEIQEQSELEARPEGWSDPRDAGTAEV